MAQLTREIDAPESPQLAVYPPLNSLAGKLPDVRCNMPCRAVRRESGSNGVV